MYDVGILCSELVCAHRDAVHKLHGTPEAVELHALVHMHDAIGGGRASPHAVLQEAANACQDDFKHGQPTAQTLLRQQVSFPRYCNLLRKVIKKKRKCLNGNQIKQFTYCTEAINSLINRCTNLH